MKEYNKNLYPFKSQWMNIEGNQIHYIDVGVGPVILFSHPPLGSSFMYRDFVQVLSRNYRCIAIDYPGFGLSKASPDYSPNLKGQAAILKKFILQLQLKKVFLLGHDTGGPSAFHVAIEKPDLFEGLILTDTIIYPVSEYPRISRMLKIVGSPFFTWLNAISNLLVRLTFSFGVRTRKLNQEEKYEYRRMFNTSAKRQMITRMLYNLRESEVFMKNIKLGFETILQSKPTLLIYGDQDPVHQMGIANRIHNLMPKSKLFLINGEGHFPHEGKASQMSDIIHSWIDSLQSEDKRINTN